MSMFSINTSVIIIYDNFPTLTHTIPYASAGNDISPIIAEQLGHVLTPVTIDVVLI